MGRMTDYEFKVGDEVITDLGETGRITYICDCERCRERGFLEPLWTADDGHWQYITIADVENKFCRYYKIGEHIFGHIDKPTVLEYIDIHKQKIAKYTDQLHILENLEGNDSEQNELLPLE